VRSARVRRRCTGGAQRAFIARAHARRLDTLTHGSWVRGTLVVALVLDVLGQLAGVVPAGSVGIALSVAVAGLMAACAWVAVRSARPSAAHSRHG
jgi:hypothetical protein